MKYTAFASEFKNHIKTLNVEQQFSLAMDVCKKLFPDYKDFFYNNNWGNPDILLDAISFCQASFNNLINKNALSEFLQKLDKNTPHSDDFADAVYAINAAGAIDGSLRFLLNRDAHFIFEIGNYLINSIDSKLYEDEEIEEEQIDEHPLMIETYQFLLGFG